jgi:hypothetical protein
MASVLDYKCRDYNFRKIGPKVIYTVLITVENKRDLIITLFYMGGRDFAPWEEGL